MEETSIMSRLSATNLQGTRVHDVGGCALDVVHNIVKSRAEVQLVTVFFHITDVRRADAVFKAQEGRTMLDGFRLKHIDGGQGWTPAVQGANQSIGFDQFRA